MNGRNRLEIDVLVDQLTTGGVQRAAVEEVRYLGRLGYNATLLSLKPSAQFIREKFVEWRGEVLNKTFQVPLRVDFKFPGFSFFSFSHTTSPLYVPFILKNCPDIIISHGTYTCFSAYMLRKIKDIHYIAFIWDPISYILKRVYIDTSLATLLPILIPLGAKVDRMIADASDMVIIPSKYHENLMRMLTSKPIKIVYPGVESAAKIPNKRSNYFLAVARWEHGKRPFFLLDVMEKLKRRGLRMKLLMLGPWRPGIFREKFLKEVKKRGLMHQIRLNARALGKAELARFYIECRALVHPITESFGMIGLEAAAHGSPLIIPQASGVTDVLSDEVHGFFPKEGDVDEFAKCMERLALDERLAWLMGNEAWSVAKLYSWEAHARKLVEIAESLSK